MGNIPNLKPERFNMRYVIAVFSSITMANRVKKEMDRQPGFVSLMHSPTGIPENGCSYSLRFREEMLERIIAVAARLGIKIKNFYVEGENHTYERMDT